MNGDGRLEVKDTGEVTGEGRKGWARERKRAKWKSSCHFAREVWRKRRRRGRNNRGGKMTWEHRPSVIGKAGLTRPHQ